MTMFTIFCIAFLPMCVLMFVVIMTSPEFAAKNNPAIHALTTNKKSQRIQVRDIEDFVPTLELKI